MSEFSGFTEAARLFAENMHVVTAMQEVFEREVNQLLNVLAEKITRLVHPLLFWDQKTPIYRYWWIGPHGKSRDKHARIWFRTSRPEIVTDSKLILQVYGPESAISLATRIRQIHGDARFLDFCSPPKSSWSFLQVELEIGSGSAIEQAAFRVSELLQELHRIEKVVQWEAGQNEGG